MHSTKFHIPDLIESSDFLNKIIMIEIPLRDPLVLKLSFLPKHLNIKKKHSRPKRKIKLDKIQHF